MNRFAIPARLATASVLALALAACDDRGARVDAPEPASLGELAAISDLPYAEPAPIEAYGPGRGYPLAERAYGLQRAVYDAPPDYGFGYEGEEALVWETEDDWELYAEPWDGGYRYYYYEPGQAYPYFVRDRDYGYGYDRGGILVAVFDSGGRYLSRDVAYRVAPVAGRYYARGHDLWNTRRRAPRIAVTQAVWETRAPQVVRTADPWLRAAREQPAWRGWREADQDKELKRFEKEQRHREKAALKWRERRDERQGVVAIAPAPIRGERRFDARQARAGRDHQTEGQQQAALAQQRDHARAEQDRRGRFQAEQVQAQRQAREQALRQQQAQHQQAERQEQAQHQQRRQAERQQAQAQQAEQRAQAQRHQAEQQQQARNQHQQQAERQQAQAQQHAQRQAQVAQARAAEQHGKAAAARQGGGKPDKPHGRDKKD